MRWQRSLSGPERGSNNARGPSPQNAHGQCSRGAALLTPRIHPAPQLCSDCDRQFTVAAKFKPPVVGENPQPSSNDLNHAVLAPCCANLTQQRLLFAIVIKRPCIPCGTVPADCGMEKGFHTHIPASISWSDEMLAGHHPAFLTVAFQTAHDQSMLSLVSHSRARFAIRSHSRRRPIATTIDQRPGSQT